MVPLQSFHPFKAIYTIFFLLITIPKLAILSLSYLFTSLGPLPEWNHKTSLGTAVLRAYFQYFRAIRYQKPPQLAPGNAKERFFLIDPLDLVNFSGVLAPVVVKPAPVEVVWHPTAIRQNETPSSRKFILLMAGGAFVLGWGPNVTGRNASDVLAS